MEKTLTVSEANGRSTSTSKASIQREATDFISVGPHSGASRLRSRLADTDADEKFVLARDTTVHT
jgi:hypothetical protein